MNPRLRYFSVLVIAAAFAGPSAPDAMERTTHINDRASNAAVTRHLAAERADQLAELAAIQAQVTAIVRCSGKGKFYTPGAAGIDAHGCSDITVTYQ